MKLPKDENFTGAPNVLLEIYEEALASVDMVEDERLRLAMLGLIGAFEEDMAKRRPAA